MNETKNLAIVLLLSAIVMISWQYFYEIPRLKQLEQITRENKLSEAEDHAISSNNDPIILKDRNEALKESKRVLIKSDTIQGSIALKGAKLDDILLTNYRENINENSEKVKLFSPNKSKEAYFAEFGWLGSSSKIDLPGNDTIWNSDSEYLSPNKPLSLSWINNQGIEFILKFELDKQYMIRVFQTIKNHSTSDLALKTYGRINRILSSTEQSFAILHEGAIGVINDKLHEIRYKDLKNDELKKFTDVQPNSWFGITDKYWLSSIIPVNATFDSNFSYSKNTSSPRYQVDFVSKPIEISANSSHSLESLLFVGPKKLELLDSYSNKYHIKLFDRAVDFGWFYFLTKPMFTALQMLYNISGNFGIAILLLTVIVKIMMFPLANKSYKSMNKMKALQPKVAKLKDLYDQDKLKLNQEIMALYKKEHVNPLSGCLPIFIQIPVFFSLYKVLFVTIEMRHTKFFGWIHDLSAPDPTSIWNLFGLLPWTSPNFFTIGIWPLIMGLTMYYQQRLNPEPTDPLQAKVMKFLPLIFTFMFYSFPAGLIIYWAWNNSLSILQQWYLIKKTGKNAKKL